jgi:predicted ATPase
VIEDLHWGDEATLDVLRRCARRIDAVPALLVATYRDDGLHRSHPLRIMLGELPSGLSARHELARLSRGAVATLVRRRPRSTRTSCSSAPAAIRFTSPRSWPPAVGGFRRRFATTCSRAPQA